MSTAPLPPVLRLCFCTARLFYFESNSYGFCDIYCRRRTGSRPERTVGSLLVSQSGKYLEQVCDCDLSCIASIPNMLSHLGLLPGLLGNWWKKVLGSWLGLLPQHVTGMSSILRCSRSYFSLFAHHLQRQVSCSLPQSRNRYIFCDVQVSTPPPPPPPTNFATHCNT